MWLGEIKFYSDIVSTYIYIVQGNIYIGYIIQGKIYRLVQGNPGYSTQIPNAHFAPFALPYTYVHVCAHVCVETEREKKLETLCSFTSK